MSRLESRENRGGYEVIVVTVANKCSKIDGFKHFEVACRIWAEEVQTIWHGSYALEFWLSNERFPVAKFSYEGSLVVQLFYYPTIQTVACLSGKAFHNSKQKVSKENNIFKPYLEKKFSEAVNDSCLGEC